MLCRELMAVQTNDEVCILDFLGDLDERLDGPGSQIGEVLGQAARRGAGVFGLLWRSHPKALRQSEKANAEFVRQIDEDGRQVLLDAHTRRAGSHHQKLVVLRHPGAPGREVAFIGGIDLGYSRNDDSRHRGDPQLMQFPDSYGPRPPWHDIQAEVRGPAVHDLEHEPSDDDSTNRGPHAVQVLRSYPAWLRRYPFALLGERSIAHAYRKALARARSGWFTWRTSTCGRLRWPSSPPRPCGTTPTCTSSRSCRATRTTTARSPGCPA